MKPQKKITAWAFLAEYTDHKKKYKYFIKDPSEGDSAEIYLKKPPARRNPFDYSWTHKKTWKPTKIQIFLPKE